MSNQKMALPLPTPHLTTFVQSMFDEGILDSQFAQIQALQDSSNPNFVNEVITLFCNDAEKIITDMNNSLSHSNVDYSMLDSCVHLVKGSSSRCLNALTIITQEYCLIRNKFQTLIQLEKGILAWRPTNNSCDRIPTYIFQNMVAANIIKFSLV